MRFDRHRLTKARRESLRAFLFIPFHNPLYYSACSESGILLFPLYTIHIIIIYTICSICSMRAVFRLLIFLFIVQSLLYYKYCLLYYESYGLYGVLGQELHIVYCILLSYPFAIYIPCLQPISHHYNLYSINTTISHYYNIYIIFVIYII